MDHQWLSLAGTTLSALGTTLTGFNTLAHIVSQMEHTVLEAAPAMAGGAVSGALALASGWLTAAKLGTAGAGLSLSTIGLGAGCLYASAGFLWFVSCVMRVNTDVPPIHAPVRGSREFDLFPSPEWLSTRVLNWGVMGRVGVGKSTLINSLRGLTAKSPDAAPVGVGHTTRRPQPYTFVGDIATLTNNMARLWDLPGAGTRDWPRATYIKDAGLRHFDGVVFVTAGAFSEAEVDLMNELMSFKVPYYVVRNKVDQDVLNNEQDNDTGVQETLREIRDELAEYGCEPNRTFLIAAKIPECADYDFGRLLSAMAADAAMQRVELPEFHGDRARTATKPIRRALSAPRRQKPAAKAAALAWIADGVATDEVLDVECPLAAPPVGLASASAGARAPDTADAPSVQQRPVAAAARAGRAAPPMADAAAAPPEPAARDDDAAAAAPVSCEQRPAGAAAPAPPWRRRRR